MRQAVKAVGKHDDPERFRKLGVQVITEHAEILDGKRVRAGAAELHARRIVVATGSRTAVPPIPGLAEAGFITHVEAFGLSAAPRSITILGAGPIGIELAQVFSRFGSSVTVVEAAPQVLPREDREISDAVGEVLAAEGIRLILGKKASSVERHGTDKRITLEDGIQVVAQEILVATGRSANIENFGLEAAGVKATRAGIEVGDTMRSNIRSIYAAGDVAGKFQFTHVAEYQARIVSGNILLPFKRKARYEHLSWAIYSDPEVGHTGLTEQEAIERGIPHRVYRYAMKDLDRAIIEGRTVGLFKLIATPSGKLLGGHIVGPAAGELVQTVQMAMANGIRIGKLAQAIRVYPTMMEGLGRTADNYYREKLSGRIGSLLRWLARSGL
jgi:pyruvate/2-oxoglutarate dehydrogenase complex dihydrolipoamide dehydrogenase (E3) component